MSGFSGAAPVKVRKARYIGFAVPADVRSFSGAAPVKVRKVWASMNWLSWSAVGFSGAAPVKVRKVPSFSPRIAAIWRFSGAAPVKVRKVEIFQIGRDRFVMLQWGRTREGAEGLSSSRP